MKSVRNKINLNVMLAVFVLITLLFPSQAFSQVKRGQRTGQKMGQRMERPEGQMQLSTEQKEKIGLIRNRYSDLLDDVVIEIRQARFEMMAEMRKDNPDRPRIEAKLSKVMELQEKRHKIFLDEFFEIREVLTPEQNKFFVRRMMRNMMREGNRKKQ
jgi:Spy/CpxP family protein refolding chaperone